MLQLYRFYIARFDLEKVIKNGTRKKKQYTKYTYFNDVILPESILPASILPESIPPESGGPESYIVPKTKSSCSATHRGSLRDSIRQVCAGGVGV